MNKSDLKALRAAAYESADAALSDRESFAIDFALEIDELQRLGSCSKRIAKRACAVAKHEEFRDSGLSLSEYVDLCIERARIR